jgi:hypothetical protein
MLVGLAAPQDSLSRGLPAENPREGLDGPSDR